MSKEPDILDAAHTIRFHLRELFSDTEAETFDRKLAALLTKAKSDLVGMCLTHRWIFQAAKTSEKAL